jgi:hypothetical protein
MAKEWIATQRAVSERILGLEIASRAEENEGAGERVDDGEHRREGQQGSGEMRVRLYGAAILSK